MDCKNDSQKRLRNKEHPKDCFCNFCVKKLNDATGLKRCPKCKVSKPYEEYYGSTSTYCKACTPKPPKEDVRRRHWKNTYNLTVDEVLGLLEFQGHQCVCGTPLTIDDIHIDHDHSCCPGRASCGNCVRSVLCMDCNRALGFLRDDPDRAMALATYLWRFKDALNLS